MLESNIHCLPKDIKSLYSRIQKARHKKEVIPHEVRHQVTDLVGENETRPYYFRVEATTGAKAIHSTLYDIILEAEQAAGDEYHEPDWNNFVYTPLFKFVYKSTRPKQRVPPKQIAI